MSKNKKVESSSSDSYSDSGSDDTNPPKKQKPNNDNEEGAETNWKLGMKRFVNLREFKGKWFLDIREFYEKDGEMKPGKKGISLTMDQWQKLKSITNEIDAAIKKNV